MLAHQLGLARDQLVGAPLSRFVHSDDQSEYHLFRRRLSRTRRIENCELRLRGPEAREFWAHLEGSRWPADANGRIWRLAVSDVTERRRATELLKGLTRELERRVEDRTARLNTANQKLLSEIDQRRKVELLLRNREELLEQRVEERTRTLQSLLDISHNVVSTLQLQQVVSLILDHLQRVVGYTGCTVYLLEHDVLRVLDYRGPLDKDEALRIQLPLDETAGIRDVVLERTSVIIDDLESDSPAALQWRAAAQPAQLRLLGRARSWMAVPLLSKARVIGALRLDHEQGGYFTEQHAQLALAIANQTAVAVENARLYQQAQQLAAVEERQRLAGELHDSVAQTFYSIALAAHTVKGSPSAADAKAALAVDRILSLCDAGLAEIRGVIFALRPETIEREGLVRGLERQVAALRAREDVEIATALGEEPRASLEVKEALYRIAQEALRNVLRHASARHATIRLAQHGDHVELEVTDDGLGFDVNASYPGLGLRSMRERAARLRGRLETTSAPGQGTRVVVRVASGAGG